MTSSSSAPALELMNQSEIQAAPHCAAEVGWSAGVAAGAWLITSSILCRDLDAIIDFRDTRLTLSAGREQQLHVRHGDAQGGRARDRTA